MVYGKVVRRCSTVQCLRDREKGLGIFLDSRVGGDIGGSHTNDIEGA